MDPDDEICLCFHVSLRKVRTFLSRENPPVASLISECLGAGTGCRWCVPFLQHLHNCHTQGKPVDLRVSPEAYANSRLSYHVTHDRDKSILRQMEDVNCASRPDRTQETPGDEAAGPSPGA